MNYQTRLNEAFNQAKRLPLNYHSRYVIISDCHRGTGNSGDGFLKNQHLYFAALMDYYKKGYTYIELGDGDELWENRRMRQIMETHNNVFWLLSLYYKEDRLVMLYGNHDIVKKSDQYTAAQFKVYPDSSGRLLPLFPDMPFYSGLILENHLVCPNKSDEPTEPCPVDLYLTHGHQADSLNSTWWLLARFLVRYLWTPLKHFGVLDPTSAAKNYKVKEITEKRLSEWAKKEAHILIAGHTHRPLLNSNDLSYINSGSCVHPRCITCLEIEKGCITLVKWTVSVREDQTLFVSREELEGPIALFNKRIYKN